MTKLLAGPLTIAAVRPDMIVSKKNIHDCPATASTTSFCRLNTK